VHVGCARLNTRRFSSARAGYSCGLALLAFLFGSRALQNAVAEGDTRTITMHHLHTDEDITITFKRDGRYDDAALEKLNWFLRDWRRSEATRMDPHLIDLVWEVQRETGSKEPIQVVCGYRSPQTNAMLRRSSSGVARFSQHMLGHAMDFYIPGIPLEQQREIGLRLQRGGVGFYPSSGSPFVHMDTAGIRMWPRMTRQELVRVFPDGRTVHIPTDGKPLPGYALALADIRKRGGTPSENSIVAARDAGVSVETLLASNEPAAANPFAKLLGLAKDDADDDDEHSVAMIQPAPAAAPAAPKHPVLAAIAHDAQVAEKATVKVAVKVADVASKAKLIRTADAAPLPSVVPAQPVNATPAALTPNQIIGARGYWQGPQDGTVAPKPVANPLTAAPRRTDVAAKDSDATGTIGPFADAGNDRVAPGLALAYAEQPSREAGIAALRAAATPAQPGQAQSTQAPVVNSTTIAVKRAGNQAASAIMTASATSVSVVKAGARFENPWLRAIVLSPSVHRFLTTMALGERDFRTLATLMVKPPSAVMMTFAADPNPGLTNDRFSGTAIVFVSTVSYPMRTASLR
jgi:uncharacterized protein YcbK (DUF882 family)